MRLRTLSWRGLRFYWRTHLGVLAGCALATAIIVGALAIGDSVTYSLQETARARLRSVDIALVTPDRFFRDNLVDGIDGLPKDRSTARVTGSFSIPEPSLGPPWVRFLNGLTSGHRSESLKASGNPGTAPVLSISGILANDDGSVRIPAVKVLGVDAGFWALGDCAPLTQESEKEVGVLNGRAAARLGAKVGDTVLLRTEKPGTLPGDSLFADPATSTVAMRFKVKAIAGDTDFGRFSLTDSQVAPFNVYLPLAWLQAKMGLEGRANEILSGGFSDKTWLLEKAEGALTQRWRLQDAEMELKKQQDTGVLEVHTRRVLLDAPVAKASAEVAPDAVGVLTYFVNELRVGEKTTPYSMVAAR